MEEMLCRVAMHEKPPATLVPRAQQCHWRYGTVPACPPLLSHAGLKPKADFPGDHTTAASSSMLILPSKSTIVQSSSTHHSLNWVTHDSDGGPWLLAWKWLFPPDRQNLSWVESAEEIGNSCSSKKKNYYYMCICQPPSAEQIQWNQAGEASCLEDPELLCRTEWLTYSVFRRWRLLCGWTMCTHMQIHIGTLT